MSFYLLNASNKENDYTTGIPIITAHFECDTVADLPTLSQPNYTARIGSTAHIIDTNSTYAVQSNGTWCVQETGTDVYTKSEIDSMFTNLTAPNTGGLPTYISEISQINGVIYPITGTIDQTPTAASNNPVRSGGVVNYTYGTPPITLEDYTDLNDIYTVGSYKCTSSTSAQTIANCPTQNSFRLDVFSTIASANTGYQIQKIFPNNANGEIFMRRRTTGTLWNYWYKFQGVQV